MKPSKKKKKLTSGLEDILELPTPIEPTVEEEPKLEEGALIEEVQGEEEIEQYQGNEENEISNYPETPQEIEGPKKEADYVFKTLKDFGEKYNYPEINKIANNKTYLINLVELFSEAIEDDLFYGFALPLYPNIKPIQKPLDREIIKSMILQGNDKYLTEGGLGILETFTQESAHVGIIYRKSIDEIVGTYQVIRRNKLCVDIVIYLRGCRKQKAKTAKEMVVYFGSRYARKIYEQGYLAILATTLTKEHASLVENVSRKECKIILEKLRTEKPHCDEAELKKEAFKLSAGFKCTGTVMLRQYQGSICKEKNWEYDLVKKFGKLNEQHI